MAYQIDTYDIQARRRVKHKAIPARDLVQAVSVAVVRRYRLTKGYTVSVTLTYATNTMTYANGRYTVVFDGYTEPAHEGGFVGSWFPDLRKRS